MGPETLSDTFKNLLASVRQHIEYLKECGVDGLSVHLKPEMRRAELARPQLQAADREPSGWKARGTVLSTPGLNSEQGDLQTGPLTKPAASPRRGPGTGSNLFLSPGVVKAQTLTELQAEIDNCQLCGLCQSRTHIVFGVGDPKADLVFVGEAPGRDEDIKGEPFVGRAGQLLTEIITKGMGLRREEVYIANVVKCRPPENRNPETAEISACEPFLIKQLELIQPKVIVALGTFAAQTLLRIRTPITRMRGVWHNYHGIKVMPTFHPAYLLRNPQDKKIVWKDIQEVMQELGIRRAVQSHRTGSSQAPRLGSGPALKLSGGA